MKIIWIKVGDLIKEGEIKTQSVINAILYLFDMIHFKQGALMMISNVTGFISTIFLVQDKRFRNYLLDFLDIVGRGVEVRDIAVAISVELCIIFFFWLFSAGDFGSGVIASWQANKRSAEPKPFIQVIESSKLWKSFWKFFGVITLTGMLTCLAIICAVLGSDLLYWTCIWFLIGFGVMANGYEFYSIGENLAKMDNGGKAYPIFVFAEKALDRVSDKLLNKINKDE